MGNAWGHLIFVFFFSELAQKPFFLLFYLICHMVQHPLPPILSQLRHPWPLLMLLVDTHGKGLFKRWYNAYCPRQLAEEGRTAKWHRQQGHCQWRLFVDHSSCPDSHFLVTVSQKGCTATSSHLAHHIFNRYQTEILCVPFPNLFCQAFLFCT